VACNGGCVALGSSVSSCLPSHARKSSLTRSTSSRHTALSVIMPVEAGQRAKAAPAPSPAPARQTVADPAWTSLQALETAAGAGMSAGAGKAVSEEDASWFAAGGRRIVEDFVQISRQM
jgi:hypothetical protein